jgi:hypothetical protein
VPNERGSFGIFVRLANAPTLSPAKCGNPGHPACVLADLLTSAEQFQQLGLTAELRAARTPFLLNRWVKRAKVKYPASKTKMTDSVTRASDI